MTDFWAGKRVFVTGHTGFKGSWLSLWLQQRGAHVSGFALAAPTTPSMFEVARIAHGMTSMRGDVRDAHELELALQQARPEIVFHLAAQPLVRDGYRRPVETYATNVMGTVHLLDAIRRVRGVCAVVNVTTDKCYENQELRRGYRESDRLGGDDPYSSSKACAELVTGAMCASYFPPELHAEHGVAIATARAGNVIGGGDWATDRLVPDLLAAYARGDAPALRHPAAVRPWQHVLDPLAGYLLIAEQLATHGPAAMRGHDAYNFGPAAHDAMPVQWVADRLRLALSVRHEAPHPFVRSEVSMPETATLRLDSSKAERELAWQPGLTLAEAIEWTAAWHRACTEGADMREASVQQLHAYDARSAIARHMVLT